MRPSAAAVWLLIRVLVVLVGLRRLSCCRHWHLSCCSSPCGVDGVGRGGAVMRHGAAGCLRAGASLLRLPFLPATWPG